MLSLSPLTVLPCSPIEQIDAAHLAGFDAIGLRILPVMATDLEVLPNVNLRKEIERKLAATRIKVFDVEVARIGPNTDLEALRPALDYARDLGARTFAVTSLTLAEYDPAYDAQLVQKLRRLCDMASKSSLDVMLEFMAFRGVSSLQAAIHLAHQVNHPAMGICLDTVHLARSGGTPATVAAMDTRLLRCVQLCDAPTAALTMKQIASEARGDRLLPGMGDLPLVELLRQVPRDLPMSVEVPMKTRDQFSVPELALQAFKAAQDLLAKVRSSAPYGARGPQ